MGTHQDSFICIEHITIIIVDLEFSTLKRQVSIIGVNLDKLQLSIALDVVNISAIIQAENRGDTCNNFDIFENLRLGNIITFRGRDFLHIILSGSQIINDQIAIFVGNTRRKGLLAAFSLENAESHTSQQLLGRTIALDQLQRAIFRNVFAEHIDRSGLRRAGHGTLMEFLTVIYHSLTDQRTIDNVTFHFNIRTRRKHGTAIVLSRILDLASIGLEIAVCILCDIIVQHTVTAAAIRAIIPSRFILLASRDNIRRGRRRTKRDGANRRIDNHIHNNIFIFSNMDLRIQHTRRRIEVDLVIGDCRAVNRHHTTLGIKASRYSRVAHQRRILVNIIGHTCTAAQVGQLHGEISSLLKQRLSTPLYLSIFISFSDEIRLFEVNRVLFATIFKHLVEVAALDVVVFIIDAQCVVVVAKLCTMRAAPRILILKVYSSAPTITRLIHIFIFAVSYIYPVFPSWSICMFICINNQTHPRAKLNAGGGSCIEKFACILGELIADHFTDIATAGSCSRHIGTIFDSQVFLVRSIFRDKDIVAPDKFHLTDTDFLFQAGAVLGDVPLKHSRIHIIRHFAKRVLKHDIVFTIHVEQREFHVLQRLICRRRNRRVQRVRRTILKGLIRIHERI